MKNYFLGFIAIIVFLLIVFYSPLEGWLACETGWIICPPPSDLGRSTPQKGELRYVEIAGQRIKVELASTREAQAQGLSGRSGLNEDEGMLFVFSTQAPKFWMKDMKFPIDMIWISGDLKVVYIKKGARPELYPETYGPKESATKYVLEVVSGFSDKNNLQEGDKVEFD